MEHFTKRRRLSNGAAAVTSVAASEAPKSNAASKKTLFVRSLPATATSDALTELFSQNYPLKHATVVLDPETKQSKGYGFVTFADAEDAQRARDEFNGHNFQGRKLKVEIAEPRHREASTKNNVLGERKSSISTEAHGAKLARQERLAEARKPPKLIVRNLPWSIKEPEQLAVLFRKYGKVKHATLPKVKQTQAGFGFVIIRGRKNAEKALAGVNGLQVDGRTLAVDWAVEKEVWEGQKKDGNGDDGTEDDQNTNKNDEASEDDAAEDDAARDGDDDLANFMKDHFDDLEDEDEDDEEYGGEDGEKDEDEDMEEWDDDDADSLADGEDEEEETEKSSRPKITDNSSTLFIRNLPFTVLDAELNKQFMQFGPVRYARVVMDQATQRPRGTGFVCFFNVEDADKCFRGAPRYQPTGANATKKGDTAPSLVKHSILQDEAADTSGMYTMEGRVLQVVRAVEKEKAVQLTEEGLNFRDNRDKDKRRLYLLSEGTVAAGTPLYDSLSPSEIKMRQDSATQRKKLIQNNPTLHLSLTRLSIRNLPRNITSKDLKALAREAVVGFAKDVKDGKRAQLSKEEEARGGEEMRLAEKFRKQKGKGIVKQSKIVFEGREGAKVPEDSGAGRSRGYGFVEYSSHRWALMGLRWLNGHPVKSATTGKLQRLIVEFAIENASVVARRKEREEKARIRSMQVLKARETGEAPDKKEKKVLSRDAVMARTRKGMGGKGRKETGNGKKQEKEKEKAKSRDDGKGKRLSGKKAEIWSPGDAPKKGDDRLRGLKRKRGTDDANAAGKVNVSKSVATSAASLGEDETKLARRQHIVGKKRAMRKARKKGGA